MRVAFKWHVFKLSWLFLKWGRYPRQPVGSPWWGVLRPRLGARRRSGPSAAAMQLCLPELSWGPSEQLMTFTWASGSATSFFTHNQRNMVALTGQGSPWLHTKNSVLPAIFIAAAIKHRSGGGSLFAVLYTYRKRLKGCSLLYHLLVIALGTYSLMLLSLSFSVCDKGANYHPVGHGIKWYDAMWNAGFWVRDGSDNGCHRLWHCVQYPICGFPAAHTDSSFPLTQHAWQPGG